MSRYTEVQKLPPGTLKQLKTRNYWRRQQGLSDLEIKVTACVRCGCLFETTEKYQVCRECSLGRTAHG